ncbi:zf-HC2 domain-containing protein [Geodermatophilus sp. SYSU D01119]
MSTSTGGWHADEDLLSRYVRGDAGPVAAASLEQHLLRCASCRDRIAAHVPVPLLDAAWERVRDEAVAGRPRRLERLLVRLGVPASDALLVATAPSLRTSWLVGLVVTLVFVGLGAAYGGDRGLTFFLLVAPLVPVAGVAFAYGPDADPSHEAALATPYPATRLLLLRTAAVLAASLPPVLVAALLVPALSWTAVAWLLPALSLTAALLAASTWVRPTVTAAALGAGWTAAVTSASRAADPTAVLAPALLVAYAVLGCLALLVLVLRSRSLTTPGSPS